MLQDKIIFAGAGGQGALRAGQMMAYAALDEGWEVEWLPSYGAEMRGGTANCNVVISGTQISFPMVTDPDYLIVMNDLSLSKFERMVRPSGSIILDSSIITQKVSREDLHAYYVPSDDIAEEEGNKRGANMVLLGAYIAITDKITLDSVYKVIEHSFMGAKEKYADSNKRLVKRGFDFVRETK